MSSYTRNQVELLESMLETKFTNEQLVDVFRFVEDVYHDGLSDKIGTTEGLESSTDSEIQQKIKELRRPGQALSLKDFL